MEERWTASHDVLKNERDDTLENKRKELQMFEVAELWIRLRVCLATTTMLYPSRYYGAAADRATVVPLNQTDPHKRESPQLVWILRVEG